MTVNYTTNLALGQPVTGTESGTWGDDVNNSVTSYLDIAIAGGLAITITTTDVTLSLTQGTSSATNIGSTTAQYAILNISGAMTAARNLILPSSSRQYVINNNTTGGFALTVKGAATTGVTMVNGESSHIYWNGSDYAKLSNAPGGAGTFTNLTYTGTLTGSTGVIAIGTNQIYKDSSGNVGIGTASPGYKLDVQGATASTQLKSTTGTNYVAHFLNNTGGFTYLGVESSAGGSLFTGTAAYEAVFGTVSAYPVGFATSGTERMRIDSSGNVGIGTSLPSQKLDVVNTANSGVGIRVNSTNAGSSTYGSLIFGNDADSVVSYIQQNSSGNTTLGGGNSLNVFSKAGAMTFSTASTERMRIDSSGNVGIGTSSPSYKLDVANSDAQIYGVRVGRGAGAVSTNTVLGNSVLPSNSTGSSNTAIGYRAGNPITTGIGNTFLGPDTGYGLQSSASYNTVLGAYALNASASVGPTGAVAVGYSAGYYLKNADYSVVIGYQAGAFGGFYQTSPTVAIGYQASQYNYGVSNTAIGYQANNGNAVDNSSYYNTAVGYQTLYRNVGLGNTAVGTLTGYYNTSGASNTFIGSTTAYSNTTGSYNTALGASSLYYNQTNSYSTAIGSRAQFSMQADGNTSIGRGSLYGSATPASNTGGYNTAIGYQAIYDAFTTGTYNTVIGANAGYSLTTGSQNVLIGSSSTASTAAGYAITTGQYNVVIGPYTGNSGGLDIRTASNFVVFADGQSNIRQVFNSSGVSLTAQGAPASITTTATLTGAQVLGGLINTTGTTYTVTMPLGTSLDTALVGCPTDFAFNFSVINTASGTITMAVNTGITSLGSLSISTGTSATYRVRKTAANTFVMYRI